MSKAPAIQARISKYFLTTTATLLIASAGSVSANGYVPEITSPYDGEQFFANDIIELIAHDYSAPDNVLYWAVRFNTCEVDPNANVAGNVGGFAPPNNTDYIWESGDFYSMIDASTLDAGNYCFIFNNEGGINTSGGVRLTREFVITEVLRVGVDIKPGSDPNCFNINGHGVIPVAILGSDSFDAAAIDPFSLSFGDLAVRVRGKKGPLCGLEDTNGDGYLDLVCHFEDEGSEEWTPGEGEASVTGALEDGTQIMGSDSICVVP